MREETINIYKFDELSEESKEKALNKWREADQGEHLWNGEYKDTLNAFVKFIDLFEVNNFQYGGYDGRDGVDISWFDNYVENNIKDIKGVRLWKYLQARYIGDKEDSILRNDATGHIITGRDNFDFTGFCADYDILRPMIEFLDCKTINQSITFEKLIQDCLNSWVAAAVKDLEWQNSDEAITETLKANDYEFVEDGTMI